MNLLEETRDTLKESSIKESEVLWVGSKKIWFTWEEFVSLANVEYSCGYGCAEIARDLIIVGKDFWLERGEYDGSEWWEFKRMPEKPGQKEIPNSLIREGWEDLDKIV